MDVSSKLPEQVARFTASLTSRMRGGQAVVLTYHRVAPVDDELIPDAPSAATFAWQMRVIAEHFQPLPLAEAATRAASRSLPARAVCVTFDDGYADNATVALPILLQHRVPATFFIATSYLNGGRMFNDSVIEAVRRVRVPELDVRWLGVGALPLSNVAERRAAISAVIGAIKYRNASERAAIAEQLAAELGIQLPSDLMMTSDQVRQLAGAGMEVGAHTRSHPILAELDAAAAESEIMGGRDDLRTLLGEEVNLFAYPNGRPGRDFRSEHVAMVRQAGFLAAVTTAWGAVSPASDRWQLPRIAPLGNDATAFAAKLARAYLARSD